MPRDTRWGAGGAVLGCPVGWPGVPAWGGLGWCLVNWVHGAACAGDPSPGDWFASDDAERTARAVAVCGGCPVRLECLEAGAGEGWGVWGGVPRERGRAWDMDRERDQAILEARAVARKVARREQERKRRARESPEAREARLTARREYRRKRRARASEATARGEA